MSLPTDDGAEQRGPAPDDSTWTQPAHAPEPVIPGLPDGLRDHPRYRVLRLLAQGGMGNLFLAQPRVMGRLVALKTIRLGFADSPPLPIGSSARSARPQGSLTRTLSWPTTPRPHPTSCSWSWSTWRATTSAPSPRYPVASTQPPL